MSDSRGEIYATRGDQMFLRFNDDEIERLARFGQPRSYRAGEMLARIGEPGPGLILRRVGLIESGAGPIVVGSEQNGDVLRLTNFLRRNGHPYQQLDPANDSCAQTLVERFNVEPEELPIVLCPNGNLLRNPTVG